MLKKLCCAFLAAATLFSGALAEDLPLPEPTPDDGLTGLDEESILDVLSQVPAAGEEDDSGYLVVPDDMDIPDQDVFTVLLVGTDSYSDTVRGRSDTTLLVRVDAADKTIRLVSFLRDMYVAIPGKGANRINASYAWGGAKLLRKTLAQNFGVTADAFVEVNFEKLIGVLDAVGGVDVTVSEAERRQLNSILRFYNTHTGAPESDQLLAASGLQTLTGKQALCFSRIRKIDSDFARTGRQRQVIEAAFHKVTAMDLSAITALVTEHLDAVTTDISLADALKLIPLAIRCRNATFSSLQIPAEGAYSGQTIDGMAVLVPNLRKNKQLIADFLADP